MPCYYFSYRQQWQTRDSSATLSDWLYPSPVRRGAGEEVRTAQTQTAQTGALWTTGDLERMVEAKGQINRREKFTTSEAQERSDELIHVLVFTENVMIYFVH